MQHRQALKTLGFNGEDYAYGNERYVKLRLLPDPNKSEEPIEEPTEQSTILSTETPTSPEKSTESITETVTETISEKTTSVLTSPVQNNSKTEVTEKTSAPPTNKGSVDTGNKTTHLFFLTVVGMAFVVVVLYRKKKYYQ